MVRLRRRRSIYVQHWYSIYIYMHMHTSTTYPTITELVAVTTYILEWSPLKTKSSEERNFPTKRRGKKHISQLKLEESRICIRSSHTINEQHVQRYLCREKRTGRQTRHQGVVNWESLPPTPEVVTRLPRLYLLLRFRSVRGLRRRRRKEKLLVGRFGGGSVAKSAKGAEEEKKGESRSENNVTFAYHVDPLCLAYPGMQINWGLFGNCEPRVEEREMEWETRLWLFIQLLFHFLPLVARTLDRV